MRTSFGLIALGIASAFTVGGSTVPLAAQTLLPPMTVPISPAPAAPPPDPPPPMAVPAVSTPPPVMPVPAVSDPPPGMTAAAVAVNIVRVPGKTILCGAGVIAAGGMLLVTFGSQYRAAGALFREGCGGKWIIGPHDFDRNVDAPHAIFSGEAH
jgi:hypothetical protein